MRAERDAVAREKQRSQADVDRKAAFIQKTAQELRIVKSPLKLYSQAFAQNHSKTAQDNIDFET